MKHTLADISHQVKVLLSEYVPDTSLNGTVALVDSDILIYISRVEEEVSIRT
jgi:hypothetical protein